MENNEPDLSEEPLVTLVPAHFTKRLLNYLIDVIIFSFLLSFLLVVVAPVYPLMQKIMAGQPMGQLDQLMIIFLYGLYMSVVEALLKGKSVGKYITGTRAVDKNGWPANPQTAFFRGLIRMVPFEQFSVLLNPERPWHDKWSNSIVVDERRSILP